MADIYNAISANEAFSTAKRFHDIIENAHNFIIPIMDEIKREAQKGKFEAKIAFGPESLRILSGFSKEDIEDMTDKIIRTLQEEYSYKTSFNEEETEYGLLDVITVNWNLED